MRLPIITGQPVSFLSPNNFFQQGPLLGMIPTAPTVVVEYDWQLDLPSANNACDGKLHIYSWLHVTEQVVYDEETTLQIDRLMLPYKASFTFELDTDMDDEVEYCPTWQKANRGGPFKKVKDFKYKHDLPIVTNDDPPDTDGEKMESTTTFKWTQRLVELLNVDSIIGGGTIGLGNADIAGNVHWILDLQTNLVEYDGFIQESASTYADPNLDQDIFLYINSDDSSAVYQQGTGPQIWSARYQKNDQVT